MWSGIMLTINKLTKTQEIALIGILAAVNISSRIFLQFLPNIKPVTSIIIISVLMFDLSFGVKLAVVTTLISNMFLGMGTWTFFQILAWVVICLLTELIKEGFHKVNKEPPVLFMAIFAFLAGFIFGFVVSLDHLIVGGPIYFLTYYLSGLSFDFLHASGNLFFYLACFPVMKKIFTKEIKAL